MKERKENKLDFSDSEDLNESDSDSEYEREERLFKRGKKCLKRWIVYIIYHYLFNKVSNYILLSFDKKYYILTKYSLLIPKILIVLWLTK